MTSVTSELRLMNLEGMVSLEREGNRQKERRVLRIAESLTATYLAVTRDTISLQRLVGFGY